MLELPSSRWWGPTREGRRWDAICPAIQAISVRLGASTAARVSASALPWKRRRAVWSVATRSVSVMRLRSAMAWPEPAPRMRAMRDAFVVRRPGLATRQSSVTAPRLLVLRMRSMRRGRCAARRLHRATRRRSARGIQSPVRSMRSCPRVCSAAVDSVMGLASAARAAHRVRAAVRATRVRSVVWTAARAHRDASHRVQAMQVQRVASLPVDVTSLRRAQAQAQHALRMSLRA